MMASLIHQVNDVGTYFVRQCHLPHAENSLITFLSCREGSEEELRIKT